MDVFVHQRALLLVVSHKAVCWVPVLFILYIKCKKLISLQHRVRAMKSHIQNSTNHFFRG